MRQTATFPKQRDATWLAGIFVGVVVAQALSAALWNHQGGTHIAWFPGAVLLGSLLAARARMWPALMATTLLGLLAMSALAGLPVVDTALVVTPPILLTPVAAWFLLRLPGETPLLESYSKLWGFVAVAVVALPVLSATLIDRAVPYTAFRGTILSDWANIALAHALGYALYIPVWISARSPTAALRHAGRIPLEFYVGMAGALALLGIGWFTLGERAELMPLLVVAPAPILLAACLRTQMSGSSVVVFVIALMAAHLSVRGYGPFVARDNQGTTLAVQLWSLAAALCALAVSVVVEQGRTTQRALNRTRDDMRELAGRLIATQEQERARLARDLHDDISQRLAATSIGLSALRRRVPDGAGEAVGQIQSQVISLSEDLRLMSHHLHPSWLSHAGLHGSLETLCAAPRGPAEPRVELNVTEEATALSGEIALCFYRVAQEALNNALRHAGASTVTVDVSVDRGRAILSIADNGRGFDPHDQRNGPGIGLISMSERAKLLGGSFDLKSTPGKGVDLCIRIPLQAA